MSISESTTISTTATYTRPATNAFQRGNAAGSKTDRILEVVTVFGDEVVAYMCADCNRTWSTYRKVLGHRKTHSTKAQTLRGNSPVAAFFKEHDRLQRDNDRLSKKLKEERSKRISLERRLAQIESLFTPRNG